MRFLLIASILLAVGSGAFAVDIHLGEDDTGGSGTTNADTFIYTDVAGRLDIDDSPGNSGELVTTVRQGK